MVRPQAAAIYARISEDRAGEMLGIKRQLEDCEKFAAQRDWPVVDRYWDDDVSAYLGKPRPEYRRMLGDIAAGRIDAVVVWHQDRLHRHPKELEEFFETCDRARLVHLASVQGEIDLSTHDGRFHARIMGAVARKESDDKSRRATRKHLEIAQSGRWAGGQRPYGYNDQREVIPEEAEIIREAARRLLAGEPIMSVAKDFNRRSIPTARVSKWTCQTLKHIVMHPSRRTNRSARRYLLASLLRCGVCGASLHSHPNHGRPAYACISGPGFRACGRISILALPVEEFISDAVLYRLDSPALARALARRPDRSRELADLELHIANDQAKLEELAGFWADGKIDSPEYFVARQRIVDRLAASRARFGRLDDQKSLRGLIDHGADLRRKWAGMNLHQRRAVITVILDHVVVSRAQNSGKRVDVNRLQPVWRI